MHYWIVGWYTDAIFDKIRWERLKWSEGDKISPNQKLIVLCHMQFMYDIFGSDFLIFWQEFPYKLHIFAAHQNALYVILGKYNKTWYLMNQMGTGHFRKQTHFVHTSCICFIFCINSWNPLAASTFIFYKQKIFKPELSFYMVSKSIISSSPKVVGGSWQSLILPWERQRTNDGPGRLPQYSHTHLCMKDFLAEFGSGCLKPV